MPINHMVVVSADVVANASGRGARSFQAVAESAALAPAGSPRFNADDMRRSLEMIIRYTRAAGAYSARLCGG